MGYYTDYTLKVYDKEGELIVRDKEEFKEVEKAFIEITEFTSKDFDDLYYGVNWKWYEAESDIEELASRFPSYYFILEGAGEDKEDWWVLACHGNEHTIQEVTPPSNCFDDYWCIE